jgi:hypothetical protein
VHGLKFFLLLPILANAGTLRQITELLDAVMKCLKTRQQATREVRNKRNRQQEI